MKKFAFVLIGCLFATGAFSTSAVAAETKGFQLSLIPDIAIHSKDTYIKGVSIGIWNENPQTGFAWGFVNGATGDSSGFMLGNLANYAENYTGIQFGAIANYNKGKFKGVQSASFNYAGTLTGLQLGVINYAKSVEAGVQIGLINIIASNKTWFGNFPEELAPGMVVINW
jgi:hypothetical protein